MVLRPSKACCPLSTTSLGLNLDLVTGETQAGSQRKGTLIFSQVPLQTNDGKTVRDGSREQLLSPMTILGLGWVFLRPAEH